MRLEDYFKQQSKQSIGDIAKFSLYQDVLSKKSRRSLARKKYLLHMKSFIYWLSIAVFVLWIYGTYFFTMDENGQDNYFVHNILNNVSANSIANVVRFEWDYHIECQWEWENMSISNIQNWDIVTLQEDTQMVFNIGNESQVKIPWPAKFILNKWKDDKYRLDLIYGDFVHMKSLTESNEQYIKVVAQSIVLNQDKSNDPMNFEISKDGNKYVVKNNGSKLSITTQDNIQNHQRNLEKQQQITIETNDITLLTIEDLKDNIQKKDVSQTFFRKKVVNNTSTEINKNSNIFVDKEFEEEFVSNGEVNTGIVDSLSGILVQKYGVLTPTQNNKLSTTLNKSFLASDFTTLVWNYLNGNQSATDISLWNIERKIDQLYQSFDLTYTYTVGSYINKTTNIKWQISNLVSILNNDYLVPPRYIDNLNTISRGLTLLDWYEFWGNIVEETINISDIQSQIVFK